MKPKQLKFYRTRSWIHSFYESTAYHYRYYPDSWSGRFSKSLSWISGSINCI